MNMITMLFAYYNHLTNKEVLIKQLPGIELTL